MKKNKIIYKLIIALLIISACTDNVRDLDFLDKVLPPTNLTASYDITQDNTGLVTITPTAEGAQEIQVFFGDGTNEFEILTNGESVQRTYKEGTFDVKIVASNAVGNSIEIMQQLIVSFKAPQNLVVVIENDAAVSKQVNVTANADFATMFDFYSGQTGSDPVTGNIGETITFQYDEAGTYSVRVVAKGGAIATTEYTEDFIVTEILDPTTLAPNPPLRNASDVISLFSDVYTNVTVDTWNTSWSQASFEDVTINGNAVKKYTSLGFNGIETTSNPLDASSMTHVHLDVWTPNATEIKLKLVDFLGDGFDDGSNNSEAELTFAINTGEWTSIDIPLADFTAAGITSFADINQYIITATPFGSSILFVDNFYFHKPPSELQKLPVNFESSTLNYTWTGFGDPNFSAIPTAVISNPDKSGINTTNTVLEIEKPSGSQVWAGASMPLDQGIDFSAGTTITVKVWSPRVGTDILLKMEDPTSPKDGNGNPTVFAEVKATTTVASAWEELSFDMTTFASFSTSIAYKNVILFPDFGNMGQGEKFYFDDIEIASIKLPVNFEVPGLTYTWVGFGDPNFGPLPTAIISNPDVTGINMSSTVLEIQKPSGSQVWAGASMALDAPINFAYGTKVKIKVWSPRVGTKILFKTEDPSSPKDGNGNPTVFVEIEATSTVANQWEELTFDLTSSGSFNTSINYENVIIFPDFGNGGQGESFYFDDLILTN
ncbi:hypothetical protein H9I45_00080 [Polaribacter haliotis]|uniref:PKD domain-containing protein n=2 Tax=Polaribacter haliotis TaxID=1888915 RepID=A0A7L8AFU3_9FLAO|nr:hypothetical protein [Polaribacter haliotis]QOD60883.1 hypothetical protein H9I45_00080 [Polaribacter haliotis]